MIEDELVNRVLDAFRARGWTLAVAESCTGGELCARLSAPAGSSDVFVGGVIPYADSAKIALLDVPAQLIQAHGAVSAEVASAMASGVRTRLNADIGVGITGIAGPGGARPEKPVGLVFIAVCGPGGVHDSRREMWRGSRESNRAHSVECAFESLLQRATANS